MYESTVLTTTLFRSAVWRSSRMSLGFCCLMHLLVIDLCIYIKHSRYLFADDMGNVWFIILAFNSLALVLFAVGVTNTT